MFPILFLAEPLGEKEQLDYFAFYSIKRKISGLSRIIHMLKKIQVIVIQVIRNLVLSTMNTLAEALRTEGSL